MQAFNLNDFQWLEYYPGLASRVPEVTINADSVVFNAASLNKLSRPSSVKLLFDPDGKRLALQGFTRKGNGTIDFPAERKAHDFGVFRHDKVQFIRGLMPAWDPETRFKAKGVYHEEENVMVYDLNTASEFKGGSMPTAISGKQTK